MTLVGLALLPVSLEAGEPLLGGAPPHVLVILADDLGWNDVGYHGGPIATPNIDRIAHEGIELDRFYVQPSCSPTRAALMTGKLPMALGIYRPIHKISDRSVPQDEQLLPEYLRGSGYQTWLVGKWHLGHHFRWQLPNQRGFDHSYGSLTGGIGYWNKVHGGGYDWHRNGKTLRDDRYATELLVEEVERLVAARDPARPSFLYLAFQAPHLPNEAPERYLEANAGIESPHRRGHAAMVQCMDEAIGRVLALYEAEGMLENTVVFFSSDNGGLIPPGDDAMMLIKLSVWLAETFGRPLPIRVLEFGAANAIEAGSDNTPLPGGKMDPAEGGARVPAAVWWPGRLESVRPHAEMMTIADLLPTLLEAIEGAEAVPDGLHGASQLEALRGGKSPRPDYATSSADGTLSFYRWPWKLSAGRLFQVEADPFEEDDRYVAEPARASEMESALAAMPRIQDPGIPFVDMFLDPDFFGGEEDGRPPWADQVRD